MIVILLPSTSEYEYFLWFILSSLLFSLGDLIWYMIYCHLITPQFFPLVQLPSQISSVISIFSLFVTFTLLSFASSFSVCMCNKTNRFHSKLQSHTVFCSKVGSEAMLVTYSTQITVLIKAWQTGIILEIRMASSSNVTGPHGYWLTSKRPGRLSMYGAISGVLYWIFVLMIAARPALVSWR